MKRDAFIASDAQFALFAPEPEPKDLRPRLGSGPPGVQRRRAIAYSEPVKLELLAVAAAQPDEWLEWDDFKVPREKHQIGFCMGHVLHALVWEGRLQEKTIYLGTGLEANRPGSPDYQGFMYRWKAA